MSDNIIHFPTPSNSNDIEIHKDLANARAYVLITIDGDGMLCPQTNLVHRQDLKQSLWMAWELLNKELKNVDDDF